jgi:osmotically-inducible protein OsmY
MGEHKGKGPKGYQRSADRIREEISDRLSDDDELDASNIEVNVQGNEVTLTGTVDSKSDKRRAEDIAESISGVTNVSNQLRVGKQSEAPMPDLPSGQASGQTKTSSSTGQLKHDKAHHN